MSVEVSTVCKKITHIILYQQEYTGRCICTVSMGVNRNYKKKQKNEKMKKLEKNLEKKLRVQKN